jgi:hypothetical protein
MNVGNYNSKILTSNKNLFSADYFHVQNFTDPDSKLDFNQNNFKKTDYKQAPSKGQSSVVKDNKPAVGMAYRGNVSDFKNYIKDMSKDAKIKSEIKDKKTNLDRRNQIIAEIKKTGEVSVKDIARVVPGVSEKTLQRELIAMVTDGVLNKKGERRWSRYSIKN